MRSLISRLEKLESVALSDGPIVVVWTTNYSGLPLRGLRVNAYVNTVNVRSADFAIDLGETEEAFRERVRRELDSWPGHVTVGETHSA